MPPKKSPAASSSRSSAPAAFNFKGMKRQKTSATSSPAAPQRRRETTPTTAWVRRTVYQSGEKEGEPTNNWIYVFNPRYGENDNAKAAVEQHTLGSDKVSGFNSALNGFTVRVYTPKQAEDMHSSLRNVDPALSPDLDLDGLEFPNITIVTVTHLDLPQTQQNEEQNNVTALMLDGFSYPLYKDLRALGYDFVRGVHNIEGINRWVRVVKASEAQKAEKETAVALIDRGWEVSKSAGDAAEWNADDLDDDF